MSMRYIIRRETPENFEEIRAAVANLDEQLGPPGPEFRREVPHIISADRRVMYQFSTRKKEKEHFWVCHSIELVAETEKDFRELATELKVSDLSFLPTS